MPGREAAAAPTLARAVADLARELRSAGISSADIDARLLVTAAAGVAREALLRTPDATLTQAARETLAGYRARRLGHEPVSRILGLRAFYGRDFEVTPATLDPRPDSETLVEAALEIADREGWRTRPIRILDVGTGTGCLLATLLAELPLAEGLGTDISADALCVATRNAARVGVGDRARFACGRSLDGVAGTFDLVVANPPYIPSAEIAALDADVRDYDPLAALDGGADGLDIYRELSARLIDVVPSGWTLLEVGAGQAKDVAHLLHLAVPPSRNGGIRVWNDLGGHQRCVAVRTQM